MRVVHADDAVEAFYFGPGVTEGELRSWVEARGGALGTLAGDHVNVFGQMTVVVGRGQWLTCRTPAADVHPSFHVGADADIRKAMRPVGEWPKADAEPTGRVRWLRAKVAGAPKDDDGKPFQAFQWGGPADNAALAAVFGERVPCGTYGRSVWVCKRNGLVSYLTEDYAAEHYEVCDAPAAKPAPMPTISADGLPARLWCLMPHIVNALREMSRDPKKLVRVNHTGDGYFAVVTLNTATGSTCSFGHAVPPAEKAEPRARVELHTDDIGRITWVRAGENVTVAVINDVKAAGCTCKPKGEGQ